MMIFTRKVVVSLTLLMLCALFMPRFAAADAIAPSKPGQLSSARYSSTAGEIFWTAATDNVGVIGYQVSRDGESLGILDVKSVYEPALAPDRAYTYIVRAVDRQGNQGAALQVQISAIRGEGQEGQPVGSGSDGGTGGNDGAAGMGGSGDGAGTGSSNDGNLVLYSNLDRVTLQEGDYSGVSIALSLNRVGRDKRPATLSLIAEDARDNKELRHQFSTVNLNKYESGSVLTLHLDVGVAPLTYHERRFKIVADDGVSQTSTSLVIDVTPTAAPDVYLLIGQSNMEGYSEVGSRERYEGGQDQRVERIQQLNVQPNSRSIFNSDASFRDEGTSILPPAFVIAEDPLHEPRYISVDGKEASFVGLGLTFAKQALNTSTATVYLVPAAWGATGFCANSNGNLAWNVQASSESFLGGTLLADRAMTRLNMTLRETGGVLRGILWHQGGADSNNPDCARTYADNLAKLARRIRSEARHDPRGSNARGGEANIPFIVATQSKGNDSRGHFSEFSNSKQQVDTAHRTVADSIVHSGFVNNDDLVPPQYPCGQVSCVHFGASALREQGRRFYGVLTQIWSASGAYHY